MPSSTYLSILEAVQTKIRSLSLTDIDTANVVIGKLPVARKGLLPGLPGVLIAPSGAKSANRDGGTNSRDDIAYPVLVTTLAKSDQHPSTNLDREFVWHEAILSAFLHQPLDGVATVITCEISPHDVFEPSAWMSGYDTGGIVLRFVSRESRG